MPLIGSRLAGSLGGRSSRRGRGRLSISFLLSVLAHLAVAVALLVTIRRPPGVEMLPPPSDVTMVFETGKQGGPSSPAPTIAAAPPVSPQADVTPPAEIPLPPPPPPPPPEPEPAVTAQPVPPPPATEPLAPEPAPKLTETKPAPVPPPKPAPPKPPVHQPVAPKSSDFPAPMNFALGSPPTAHRPQSAGPPRPHMPGTIDMTLGPTARGSADLTPMSEYDLEVAGADWRNALSKWVSEHAYYPPQARLAGEEGDAKVHVVVEPSGKVKSVEQVGRSGSVWLDLALLALFRDQKLPHLPVSETEPIEFDFTMHYVLIRMR